MHFFDLLLTSSLVMHQIFPVRDKSVCISVMDDKVGSKLNAVACDESDPKQRWESERGTYFLRNFYSGLCMDVNLEAGEASIRQRDCKTHFYGNRWKIVGGKIGQYWKNEDISKMSPKKCMDYTKESKVIVYECADGNDNQVFGFIKSNNSFYDKIIKYRQVFEQSKTCEQELTTNSERTKETLNALEKVYVEFVKQQSSLKYIKTTVDELKHFVEL